MLGGMLKLNSVQLYALTSQAESVGQQVLRAPIRKATISSRCMKVQKSFKLCAAGPIGGESDDDSEGLLPEDDYEVPGTYQDAMTSSTPLGKLIKETINELDTLGGLQMEVLNEAEDILKKAGFKGSLFDAPKPIAVEDQNLDE